MSARGCSHRHARRLDPAEDQKTSAYAANDIHLSMAALEREAVLARLSALQGRYPDRVVSIGHQRLAKMTDGDLRSLLADIEELLASE